MYKTTLGSVIGLLLSAQVMADSYRFEGSVNYVKPEIETAETDVDMDLLSATGTFYLSSVSNTGPLQEAAFLQRSSALSLAYWYYKVDVNGGYVDEDFFLSYTSESKFSALAIAAESYLLNDFVYVGLNLAYAKTEETDREVYGFIDDPDSYVTEATDDEDSENDWRLNLGLAPATGLLIWSEIEKDVDRADTQNLNVKYVKELGDRAFNLEAGIGVNAIVSVFRAQAIYPDTIKSSFVGIDDEDADVNSIYLLGDYYFDRSFSLGAGLSHMDNDEVDDEYMLRAKKFFGDSLSLEAQAVQSDWQDSYSIGASIRF